MIKDEFIQQTIIHAAGPMLAALDTEGEQKFTVSDVKDAANILAQKLSESFLVDNIQISSLRNKIRQGTELLEKAIEEHNTTQDWCLIKSYLDDCYKHLKLAYLQCSGMAPFFEDDEEYQKNFHTKESFDIHDEIGAFRKGVISHD